MNKDLALFPFYLSSDVIAGSMYDFEHDGCMEGHDIRLYI